MFTWFYYKPSHNVVVSKLCQHTGLMESIFKDDSTMRSGCVALIYRCCRKWNLKLSKIRLSNGINMKINQISQKSFNNPRFVKELTKYPHSHYYDYDKF